MRFPKKVLAVAFGFVFFFIMQIVFKPDVIAFAFSGWEHGAQGYARVFSSAKRNEEPLILYFNTDWCKWCKKMNKEYLDDEEVKRYLSKIKKVEINPDKGKNEKRISDQYKVRGYPSFFVFIPSFGSNTQRVYPFLKDPHPDFSNKQFIDKIRQIIVKQYSDKGRALSGQSQYEAGIACYQKAIKYDPDAFAARYGIGLTYHRMGYQAKDMDLLKKAKQNYLMALKIKPNDQAVKNNLAKIDQLVGYLQKNPVQTNSAARSDDLMEQADALGQAAADESSANTVETKCISGDCNNGHGVFVSDNGVRYEGQFKYGLFNGKGHYVSTNGGTYDGNFRNSKFHGQGTYTYEDGRIYVGQFRDDFFSGKGTLTYPDGRKYVGQFRNDKFEGHGVFYYPDGTNTEGEFRNGRYVGP